MTNNKGFKEQFNSNFMSSAHQSAFSSLSKDEQSLALVLASDLDVSKYDNVLNFGATIQNDIKHFIQNMLVQVQRNDTNSIKNILYELQGHFEKIDTNYFLMKTKRGFFHKLFHKSNHSIQEVLSHYHQTSKNIDRLTIQLQYAQKNLLKDLDLLKGLYEQTLKYYKQLNIYIAACEMKHDDLLKNQLPKIEQQLKTSSDPNIEQQLFDLQNALEWLDKKIYDMQISREIAFQAAPQIQMIYKTNELLIDKIQSSIMTTIPLWQSQISMMININKQQRIHEVSERIMQRSGEIVKKNAKIFQETSKNVDGITDEDIDQFKKTQLQLIDSIEETLRIQAKSNEQQFTIQQNTQTLQ